MVWINIPKKGDVLDIPVILDASGKPTSNYDFSSKGFEIPEKIVDVPKEILAEIWK